MQIAAQCVGSERINCQRIPVYLLPNGRRYVAREESTNHATFISVEAARAFKNGQYPLHPTIRAAAAAALFPDTPATSLPSFAARKRATEQVLRACMERMKTNGLSFRFAEN